MKGMVLAAGKGERLKPESDKNPKPLFAIGGTSLLRNAIGYLVNYGITEIAVNMFHLGSLVKKEITSIDADGVTIHGIEEKELMGTAGGIKGAERFIGDSEFVVLNSDILINLDLDDAIKFHRENRALATLVVRRNPDPKRYGTLLVDSGGRLVEFLGTRSPLYDGSNMKTESRMFTGLHIFSPEIFSHIPAERPVDISGETYPKLMESGAALFAFDYSGYWADIGTPESYASACREAEEKRFRLYTI